MNPALSTVILAVLFVAGVLLVIRLARGPTLADRIIALDTLTTVGVGVLALYAVRHDRPVYLDVALVLALVAFIGTVAFARYVEKGAEP